MIIQRIATRGVRLALAAAALVLAALGPAVGLAQPTGTAVEYYHAAFDHYFITARPSEIADIDGGKFGDAWKRTGLTIPVWTQAGPDTLPAYRFFSETYSPKSTHVYTAYASEYADLVKNPAWTLEDLAFHLKIDPLGNCPSGTMPLYRFYNQFQGNAPNHRFSTSRAVFNQMVARGWKAEGAGDLTVFACVPAAVTADPTGYWTGTTSAGEQVVAGTFADGSFFLFFGSETSLGVIDGTGVYGVPVLPIPCNPCDAVTGTSFSAPQAQLILMEPVQTGLPASVSATIVPQASMQGAFTSAGVNRSFALTYVGPVTGPIRPADLAGIYDGVAATTKASIDMTFTVSTTGAVTGQAGACTVSGTAVPRGATGLVDASLTFGGVGCSLGQGATTGVGFYEPTLRALLLVTRSAADWLVLGGTK
ncbi:MAG TPA: hypothetical protein VFX05_13300 [Casimicrobiaceae bacterium]|nr:hypothetical protein [Casimicrobiaceae bacterium]